MKLGAMPTLCNTIHVMVLDNIGGARALSYEELAKQEIPPLWEERFQLAEHAADAVKGRTLSDFIDTDSLEDEFKDICSPEDDVLETLAAGEQSVMEALIETIDTDGIKELHVILGEIFDGELTNEIKW
jgi:molecular chaperone GrpE (heat shock protein)